MGCTEADSIKISKDPSKKETKEENKKNEGKF